MPTACADDFRVAIFLLQIVFSILATLLGFVVAIPNVSITIVAPYIAALNVFTIILFHSLGISLQLPRKWNRRALIPTACSNSSARLPPSVPGT